MNCIEIKKKFNRVKGQINGIEKMIDSSRDCTDIIQQIMAARSALSSLGVEILKDESKWCFEDNKEVENSNTERFEKIVTNFFKIS